MIKSTKHPTDFSTQGLCETYLQYKGMESRSDFDMLYMSMLEDEIERRKQYPFNAREIAEYLPS